MDILLAGMIIGFMIGFTIKAILETGKDYDEEIEK